MRPARRGGIALALLAAAVAAANAEPTARSPARAPAHVASSHDAALLVWASDADAGDCGEECWGGYSLWQSAPSSSSFRLAIRQFSLTPPEISPDRRWIAYTDWGPSDESYDAAHIEIRLRPVVRWRPTPKLGRSRLLWNKTPLYSLHITWSPDSRSIAVLDSSRRRPTITVVNTTTRRARRLNTACVPRSQAPNPEAKAIDWSRRGTVAFVSGARGDGRATYRVSADGGHACRLIPSGVEPMGLAWSPAGDRLLISILAGDDARRDILLSVRSDGQDVQMLRQVTAQDPACKLNDIACGVEAPTWSPDGTAVAYLTLNTNAVSLWTIGTAAPQGIALRRLPVPLSGRRGMPFEMSRVIWLTDLPA